MSYYENLPAKNVIMFLLLQDKMLKENNNNEKLISI